ncbi:MAG: DUF4838 domain-containing protein [Gemmataceae bacterium]
MVRSWYPHRRRSAAACRRPAAGTLYAVYRFLHDQGVRWWTPWATDVPRRPELRVGDLNVTSKPAFEVRDPFWFAAFDGDWSARHLCNGHNARLTERHGGRVRYKGFVHTFYPLVPPEKHFATHPEWFSLIGGRRKVEGGQLCTTNPELRRHSPSACGSGSRSRPTPTSCRSRKMTGTAPASARCARRSTTARAATPAPCCRWSTTSPKRSGRSSRRWRSTRWPTSTPASRRGRCGHCRT